MGKIMYTRKEDGKKDVNYIAGKISFVNEGAGEMQGKVINLGITIQFYDKNKQAVETAFVSVGYFNSETSNMCDRIKIANVKAGNFLLLVTGELQEITAAPNGTRRFRTTGFDFDYNAFIPITRGEKTYALVCGTMCQKKEFEDGTISFNIPVDGWDKESKSKKTTWYSVSCRDTEKKAIGTAVKKYAKNGTPICCFTGYPKKVEKNGKAYHNTFCYDFTVI